jgi:large repetitive protein
VLRRIAILLLFCCAALTPLHAQQACENIAVPDTLLFCTGGGATIPWANWYTDAPTDPDLAGAVWIDPDQNSTSIVGQLPFAPSEPVVPGEWTIGYIFDNDTCFENLVLETSPTPDASFNVPLDGICGDLGIAFDLDLVDPSLEYSWNFGDGETSDVAQPVHAYFLDGGGTQIVPVTLTATNDEGCSSSTSQNIDVLQVPNPGLDDLDPLCASDADYPNYEITSNVQPQPLGASGISAWSIDWGNGNDTTFTEFIPGILGGYLGSTYEDYGYYTVTVEVTADNGCINVSQDSLFVGNNPLIGTANPGNTTGICSPYTLTFPILGYEGNADGTTYTIDFGDGSSQTFVHDDNDPNAPPDFISHQYTNGTCGGSTDLFGNAIALTIIASNECESSSASVEPIRIHTAPNPNIHGPDGVCVNESFTYSVSGSGEIVTSNSCDNSPVAWAITPLDGQQNVNPFFGFDTLWSTNFPAPGEYLITVEDDHPNCGLVSTEMTVCVYPEIQAVGQVAPFSGCAPLLVDLEDLTQDPDLCGNPTTTWTVSGGGFNWVSGGPNEVDGQLELLNAGEYTITLRVGIPNKDACPASEISWTVTVLDEPLIDIAADATVCEGEGFLVSDLTASNPFRPIDSWQWFVDGSPEGAWPGDLSVAGQTEGTVTVSATATNLCGSDTESLDVVVEPAPDIQFNLSAPTFCAETTATVEASGGATYTWSTDPAIVGPTTGNSVVVNADSDVTLQVTATSANGCSNTDDVIVPFTPLPEATITLPDPPCPEETVAISGIGTSGTPPYASLAWSGDTALTADAFDWVAPETATPLTVTLTVTDALGCQGSTTATLTSNSRPDVEAGPPLTVCNNDTYPVELEGYSPGLTENMGTGVWTGTGLTGPTTFTPNGVGVTTLTYTFTDANGCTASDERTITVDPFIEVDPGLPSEACFGDAAFTIANFSPSTATWTGPAVSTDGTLDPSVAPGLYVLTVANGAESCESVATSTFTVHPLPAPAIAAPLEVCEGEDFEATLSEPSDSDVFWADDANLPVTRIETAGNQNITLTGTAVTDEGCTADVSATVLVNLLPIITIPDQGVQCNLDIPTTLTGATPANGAWTGPGVIDSNGTFNPNVVGTGTVDLTYTVEDANSCVNSADITVTIDDPVTAEAGDNLSICDENITLALDGFTPATGGSWSSTEVTVDAAGNVDAGPLGPGDYELTYTYGSGTCENSDSRTLTVYELPAIALTASAPALCEGGTFVFTGEVSGGLPPYTFSWSGATLDNNGATTTTATAPAGNAGTITATLIVTDDRGCQETASITVTVWPLPVVDAGPDISLCNQIIATTLTGFSPPGGTWSGLGITDPDVGEFLPSDAGVGSVSPVYTFTDGNGCTNDDDITIDIEAPQIADAGPDTTVCDNAPLLQLNAYFPATNVTWSSTGAGGGALLDAGTGLVQPALLAPGDYTYLLEYGSGTCYTFDDVVVHVDPLPVVTTSVTDLFCENDGTVVLASGAPAGGTWEGNGITNGNGDFATGLPLTGPGTYPLEYWYEDPMTGCRDTAQHSVTVQPIPTVDAGLDTTFCNQPIPGDLLGFAPGLAEDGTGSWSGLGALAGAVAADGTVDPSVAGAGTFGAVYTYTAAATGCTHTDTVQVTIAEPLVADAGPDTTVCDNAFPLQLVGFPLAEATWSGNTPSAQDGLIDDATGLLHPGPMAPGTYGYTIEYGLGTCYTFDDMVVNIDPLPALDIASPDAFCANLGTVDLATATPAGGTWFGDGVLDATSGTYISGLTPAEYSPSYTYTDPLTGCSDTLIHSVTIHPVPVAAFDADALGCSNLDLPLTNNSTGQTTHDWDFGGVGSSAAETPGFTFPGDGTYTITLIAGNAFGCQDTTAQEVDITHPPTANFLLTPDSGCAPLDVEFANLSDAPYGTYLWTVNGDEFAQEAPPQLNFTQGDSVVDYSVSLLVSNLCGNDILQDAIVVYPAPVMVFAFEEDTVCSPFDMDLINASTGLPDDVQWDFGDGTGFTGFDPPNHWYEVDTVEQVFTVTLIGANQCGADTTSGDVLVLPNQVEAFFTLSTPDGCAPFNLTVEDFSSATTAVSYAFDNGDFAATPTASTTYPDPGTFTVTQFVTNGCSFDTLQIPITVHPVPEVALSVSDPNGCEGADFTFSSVTDNPGNADWNFGDGSVGGGLTATHAYDAPGTFTVTFSTEAPLTGCEAQESLEVEVFPNPVATIALDDPLGCAPLTATFTNASSGSQFQTWDFGDGSEPAFQSVPSHVFANTGLEPVQYDVTLVAESAQLCVDSTTVTVTVLPTPQAAFTLAEEESCTFPVDILTANTSIGSINHSWTVNGTDAVVATAPVFSADAVGTYTVGLTATNSYGCADQAEDDFTVHLAPIANLSANPRIGCNPLSVDFQDLSSYSQATSLFIDGIYDGPLPTGGLVIDQVGTFQSYIVATSPEGCTDTLTLAEDFTVHPIPFADFSYIPLTASPENTSFQFTNESNTAFATNWTFGDGNGSFVPDPLHRYDEPGEYQVILSVQNEFGCTDLAVDLLVIDDQISVFVPNAFTPASDGIGDGINDAFKPVIRGLNLIQKYKFQVFDRWGTVIFETNDYDEYWVGDVDRGREDTEDYFAQNEVYNWKVTLTLPGEEPDEVTETANPFCNGPRQFCGHVTLIR